VHHDLTPHTTSSFNNLLCQHLYISLCKLILFRNFSVCRANDLVCWMVAGLAVVGIYQSLSFSNCPICGSGCHCIILCGCLRCRITGLGLFLFIAGYFVFAVGIVSFRFCLLLSST